MVMMSKKIFLPPLLLTNGKSDTVSNMKKLLLALLSILALIGANKLYHKLYDELAGYPSKSPWQDEKNEE